MVTQRRKRGSIMGRLNKTQQYAILWLNSQKKNVVEICKELALEEKQVSRVLEKSINVQSEPSVKTASETVKRPSSKDLMIRHTSAKKSNSVAIMTKEASEVNDSAKKSSNYNPKTQKHIFRPND